MLLLLVAALLLGAHDLIGQRPITAAAVTEPGRKLTRALDLVVGGVDVQGGPRTVMLLVDATPSLKASPFASELGRALSEHAKELDQTRVGVAGLGQKPLVVVSPTAEHDRIVPAVENLLARPANKTNKIRNVHAAVRRLAVAMAGKEGQQDIVLVSFENGDAEDNIEATASQLAAGKVRFTAIVREAFLSDSYWTKRRRYWHDTRTVKVPKGSELVGGDSPFIDLPWSWVFQQTVVNEVVPSGFAAYGITRLAAASGGRVFVYSPKSATKHKCAVYGTCIFCAGDHVPSGENYSKTKLDAFAPLATSRKEALEAAARDPYLKAVLRAWRAASKAGVLQTTPAVKVVGMTAEPDRNRGGGYLGFWDSLSFDRHARRAEAAAAKCSAIIEDLESAMQKAEAAKAGGRQRAIAALTRVNLYLARTNLVSFAGWCRDVAPTLIEKDRQDPAPPETLVFPKDRLAAKITFGNMCLCHGVRPFLRVRLPGGAKVRKELRMLDQVVTGFLRKYGQTPYVVAVHRAGIARFSLLPGKTPPRARPSSKVKKGPVTGRPSRGRPVRHPGATTEGGAAGPTTGRRP